MDIAVDEREGGRWETIAGFDFTVTLGQWTELLADHFTGLLLQTMQKRTEMMHCIDD